MTLALSELKKHSNLFHPCPFKAYNYIQNYLFDFSFYPSNVAQGPYAVVVTGIDKIGKKEISI